jgi:hypothetical protein
MSELEFETRSAQTGSNFCDYKILSLSDMTRWCVSVINWFHGAESFLRSWEFLSYSRNSPHFMKTKGLSPHWQEPATCPYPEQDPPSSLPHSPFSKIHFNIIFTSTSTSTPGPNPNLEERPLLAVCDCLIYTLVFTLHLYATRSCVQISNCLSASVQPTS